PPVKIGTHRLWISLWTRWGQCEDNTGSPGGNRQASGGERKAVHSYPPPSHCRHTGAVVTQSHTGLGGSGLSPASTSPTTTTYFFITKTQKQVGGGWPGSRSRHTRDTRSARRQPTHVTGGSFRGRSRWIVMRSPMPWPGRHLR